VFDGNALDKSSEVLAIEMSKLGYPSPRPCPAPRQRRFRPHRRRLCDRSGTSNLCRTHRNPGNTRTRDYVIRREFDIAEGDAYNKTLIDRGRAAPEEPELLQDVKISNRPGSAPDRIVLDVEAVDQSTGDFNIAGAIRAPMRAR